MLCCSQSRQSIPSLDRRIPLTRSWSRFVVEVATNPIGNLFMMARGMKSAPVKLYQTTSSSHLFFQHLESVIHIKRMIRFLVVTSIGRQKNCVRIFKSRRIIRPTIEMHLDRKVTRIWRRIEQMLQQNDIFFVFVRMFSVTGNLPGNQYNLLCWLGRRST